MSPDLFVVRITLLQIQLSKLLSPGSQRMISGGSGPPPCDATDGACFKSFYAPFGLCSAILSLRLLLFHKLWSLRKHRLSGRGQVCPNSKEEEALFLIRPVGTRIR
ncbi:hypothetical protein L6452_41490 [Arctium lappa]|uniref:Uncharacterized protein n=1 Tax=Arctium lappa TaxID=4217 RepID=A0ACB8XPY4_ARCLA|nr:hypothetical protein L6452_41490 [Arctium lappa]